MEQLAKSNAYVDFTQGIDIRLMDEARTEALKDVRIKILHFAWDRYRDRDIVLENAEKLNRKLKLPRQKIECFVLTNYDSTFEQDMERVMELRKMGIDPYIMIYDKEHLPAAHPLKKLARWVNAKWIWAVCPTFEKYLEVRGTDV